MRYGNAASNAAFGPEQTNDRRPALITLALPETGAASISMPRAPSNRRNSADPSSEIDEHSTTRRGACPGAESRPPGPAITSRTSFQVDTMQKTMEHAARSGSAAATFAPQAVKGSDFARVRFHTVRSAPP